MPTNYDPIVFASSYESELEYFAKLVGRDRIIGTIFFGGGTPSLAPPSLVGKILNKISELWTVAQDAEISIEVNPTSVESLKLVAFKAVGINRISIGVQSLDDEELKFLGRKHSSDEAVLAINEAKKIFNDRCSLDLIYALHGQDLKKWSNNLRRAAELSPCHVSSYQLMIEPGTIFNKLYRENKIRLPSDDETAEMYSMCRDILSEYGIEQYEVSNYAVDGYECLHNINYWKSGEYIGIGPGAHGRLCIDSDNIGLLISEDRARKLALGAEMGNIRSNIESDLEISKNCDLKDHIGSSKSNVMENTMISHVNGACNNGRKNPLQDSVSNTTSIKSDGYNIRYATVVVKDPKSWVKSVNAIGHGIVTLEPVSKEEFANEFLIMGLRLKEGVSEKELNRYLSANILDIVDSVKFDKMRDAGLIEYDDKLKNLHIPLDKLILADYIIRELCK